MRLAALTFLVLLAVAAEAGACSCIGSSPQEQMASADAAFVGEVTAVRREAGDRVYTIAVDTVYKGEVGGTAEVRGEDPDDGAVSSCGEFYAVGDTLGGYFKGAPDEWFIHTCNRATREELEAGSAGFPEPLGSGDAVALLAGSIGSGSPFAALDASGRVIAYAKGSTTGNPVWVSPCPGGRVVVESTYGALRTRRLSDLAVLRSRRTRVADVRCLDAAGRTVTAVRGNRLVRIRGDRTRALTKPMEVVAPGPRVSLVFSRGSRVSRVDSRTGAARRLGRFSRFSDLSVSPDGTRLAVLAGSRLTVFGEDGRRLSGARTRGGREQIAWDGRRALTLPMSRLGGGVVAGRVWWARDGRLHSARSGAGPATTLGAVPNLAMSRVIALPEPAAIADPSRFNPSASGGSPPRARRARAGGDGPRGDCPTA